MKKLVLTFAVALVSVAALAIGSQIYTSLKWQQSAPTAQIVADEEFPTLTDAQYAVVDSMFWAAMRVDELREDFAQDFPKEYDQMMTEGDSHDCVECRLKGIASCYMDAVWADCFDDCNEDDIYYRFEQVLSENREVNETFNAIVKSVWVD